ncbi:MAG: ribosome maturation factor RimM [Clostridiaceae bacterium]|nr:ribosome maturation factor RimM [Clostridiaceae bacterium]
MKKVVVGKIVKAQGIKGEVKINSYTENPERFLSLKRVLLNGTFFSVEGARITGGVFLKLKGVDDRNAAEKLTGANVEIDTADRAPLEEGRYYVADIIGCTVTDGEREIGIVTDVLQYGAADVYVLKTEKGKTLFPAIEAVFIDISIDKGLITVDKQRFSEVAVDEV